MKRFSILATMFLAALAMTAPAYAQDPAADALAAESLKKCEDTAKDKITVALIIEKVDKACALIAKEGPAAFPKFRGKDSEFLFCGNYLWVHRLKDSVTLVHPVRPALEGKDMSGFKDKNGKAFFSEMNDVVKKSGSGWVEYYWPKPGAKDPSVKTSYVKLVKNGDTEYVVGCGVYDLTMEQVQKELAAK